MFNLEGLEPNKVSKDLSSYTSLIYGVPKIGKTTFAYKMFGKRALLLGFERGYKALAGVMAVDITKWSELAKLNQDLKKPSVREKFDVLVIDTTDLMDKLAKQYILQQNGIDDMGGLPYGKAYDLKDELIFNMLKKWQDMGYGLMFISHAKETTITVKQDGKEVEITKYQPSLERRTLGIVSKMCDIIGFAYLKQNEETTEEERVLFLRESLRVQAGTRFTYMVDSVPLKVEDFNKALADAIAKEEEVNPDSVTEEKVGAVVDFALNFDEIMENIVNLVKTKFAPSGHMEEVTTIVEKHMGKGAKVIEATSNQVQACDIILTELESKVQDLGL